jgi:hypothetical protein
MSGYMPESAPSEHNEHTVTMLDDHCDLCMQRTGHSRWTTSDSLGEWVMLACETCGTMTRRRADLMQPAASADPALGMLGGIR